MLRFGDFRNCSIQYDTRCEQAEMKLNSFVAVWAAILTIWLGSAAGCSKQTNTKTVVGFSQIGAESGWRTANTESIKAEAAKRGIELKFADAQAKQENQIKALRSFIAQGVDVIAFSPVVETGWEPVLKEIKAREDSRDPD